MNGLPRKATFDALPHPKPPRPGLRLAILPLKPSHWMCRPSGRCPSQTLALSKMYFKGTSSEGRVCCLFECSLFDLSATAAQLLDGSFSLVVVLGLDDIPHLHHETKNWRDLPLAPRSHGSPYRAVKLEVKGRLHTESEFRVRLHYTYECSLLMLSNRMRAAKPHSDVIYISYCLFKAQQVIGP